MMSRSTNKKSKITSADSRIYADLKQLIALQNQTSGFSFLPTQPVHSVLAGRHASRLRGRGLNFEELRHYRVGDDIRSMDWKVTNRTRKPHVRVYTEERERPLLLLVDQRQTMFFGSEEKMKSVVATEVAALIAWRMLAAGDCVGALVFNDSSVAEIKPQRSRNTVMQILQHSVHMNHALVAGKVNDNGHSTASNQLNRVLGLAQRVCVHDHLIVVISDLSGWNELSVKRIKSLSRHNDLITTLIYDPLEKELPDSQQLVVSDGELQIEVDVRKRDLKNQFTEHFVSSVEFLQRELKKYDVPVIPTNTVVPVQDQFRKSMGESGKAMHS
ncbi:MAG: DUF58 domain-containing protein [Pseudomonadales bacterium]